jgi:hypothetical protein
MMEMMGPLLNPVFLGQNPVFMMDVHYEKTTKNTNFPSKKSARFLTTKTGQTGLTVPPFADLARSSPGSLVFWWKPIGL